MKKLHILSRHTIFLSLLLGLIVMVQNAQAQIVNPGFEAGNLSGWTGSSGTGVSTGMTVLNWTVNPSGSYMASIEPISNLRIGSAESNLGLSAGSLLASNSGLYSTATNFATLTQSISLTAGQTVTVNWNFIAQDYAPFNDGVIATLVGPSYQSIKLLAVTANPFGDHNALITGDFGSTGWLTVTFTAGIEGTYNLGFASFNTVDMIVNPILIIDDGIGGTSAPGEPVVTTANISSITTSSAVSGGNVTSDGGASVSARGICWSTTSLPTASGNHTVNGSGTGSFTSNITGLTGGTTYYVRSYATNSVATVYGSQVSFTTSSGPTIPTVTTTAITSILQTSASSGGNITSDGDDEVSVRGVCWNTTGTPIVSDNHTSDGTGSGSFESSLTDLSAGVTYYIRAYATNEVGTGYGNQISFQTLRNSQIITFDPLPSKSFEDSNFSPVSSASSGLAVTFSSSNTGVATIIGTDIHIISAGSSTITANQAGDGNWLPASATQILIVSKSDQTISFADFSDKTYGAADFDPLATSSSALEVIYSSDNTEVVTIVNGKIHIAGAGSANITANQAGNGNYNPAPGVSHNLTINKATLTATADNKSRLYGAVNPIFTFSYSGFVNSENEGVIDTPPTASSSADENSNCGESTITSTGGVDNNYNISLVNATLTITKLPLTVTAENITKTYGESNPELTFVYSGFVNDENKTVLRSEPVATTVVSVASNVGSYPGAITISGGDAENYSFIYIAGGLSITKAMLVATAEDKSKEYSQANPLLTEIFTGFVNGEDETVIDLKPVLTTNALTLSDAGSYPISISTGSDNNYDFSYVPGTLTVSKAALTVIAESKTRIYGEQNPDLAFEYSGFVNGEDKSVLDQEPSVSTTAIPESNAGIYPILLNGGMDNNYDMHFVAGDLSISKATLTATAGDKTKIYGDSNPLLTTTLTGFVNGDDESVIDSKPEASTIAAIQSDAGSYVITVEGGIDNNYSFIYVNGTMHITKALLTATANIKTKTYGSVNPVFDISYSGFKNSESADVIDLLPAASSTALTGSNTGTYAITLTGGTDNNYVLSLVAENLTINKAPLIIIAENKTKIYKQINPVLSIRYSGFVLGENQSVLDVSPVIETSAGLDSDAGDYDITVSGASDGNYSFIYTNGSLEIEKADQVITFYEIPSGLRITQEHELSATASSGLPVRFETSDPILGSLDRNILTINKEGNLSISAYQDGDHNWNPAKEVIKSIVTLPTFDNISSLFTPNNDGMNDTWYIPNLEKYGELEVKVYNRFGQLVYQSASYKNDWNGTWNGYPLPSASYYYIMRSSVKGSLKGVVNLVR